MDKILFGVIIDEQEEISTKEVIKLFGKISKICGFMNLRGYDGTETKVKPEKKYGEIRLYDNKNTYSNWIYYNESKFKEKEEMSFYATGLNCWYGKFGNYLIKNIGKDCQTVYELKQ